MKHVERVAAAALALAALFALPALPSFASDTGGESSAASSAANAAIAAAMKDGTVTGLPCGQCGQGRLILTGVAYTEWVSLGAEKAVPCVHHDPWRLDEVLERTGTWTYVCDHCGHSRQDCAKETQYVHHP